MLPEVILVKLNELFFDIVADAKLNNEGDGKYAAIYAVSMLLYGQNSYRQLFEISTIYTSQLYL